MRKVAADVGISAPSIYEHFKDKKSLLHEVQQHALIRLLGQMREACRGRDAKAKLISTSLGYVAFATSEPMLFELVFTHMRSERKNVTSHSPAEGSAYAFLSKLVRDYLGGTEREVEALAFGLWAIVHGAAVLRATHLRDVEAPYEWALRRNLSALVDGWRPVVKADT